MFKKKGKKNRPAPNSCWAFVSLEEDPAKEEIHHFVSLIPDEWKLDNAGSRKKDIHIKLHITFLLKLSPFPPSNDKKGPRNQKSTVEVMREALAEVAPFTITAGNIFINRVSRITAAETYCIGCSFESTFLKDLKTRCADLVGGQVGYGGTHHSSWCYVGVKHKEQTEAIVKEHEELIANREILISAIHVSINGEVHRIELTGTPTEKKANY